MFGNKRSRVNRPTIKKEDLKKLLLKLMIGLNLKMII